MAGFLSDIGSFLSGDPSSQLSAAANKAKKQEKQATGQAIGTQQTAQTTALGELQQGVPAYTQQLGLGQGLESLFLGAVGGGTPAQNAAAGNAWSSTIPYQTFFGPGGVAGNITDTALRRGEVSGQTGNIVPDLMRNLTSTFNQQFYDPWVKNLSQGIGLEENAAAGLSNIFGTEATGVTEPTGARISSLQSGLGDKLAGITTGSAAQQAQLQQSQAGLGLNALFGIGSLALGGYGGGSGLLPGGTTNYLSALMGGSGGWNTSTAAG